MSPRRLRHHTRLGALLLPAVVGFAGVARADSAAVRTAQTEVATVDQEAGSVQAAVERSKAQKLSPEQRLANGELLFRSKDYARATVVFGEVLEEYPDTPSFPDALWLRGETFYAAKEYLSARRDYRAIVARGSEGRFQPYFGKALARLVDVSLRTNDIAGLDEVFSKLNMVPPAQVDAALLYAKGKAYYAKKDYANATQALQSVGVGNAYAHQARYFLGLVAMKTAPTPAPASPTARAPQKSYKAAIDAFRQVAELPPDSDEHRHVIDLSWMAIGRLFYEMENYQQASEAYAKVGRGSPEFDTMLYELAWVYVRLGDVQRAERALEVLQVSDPGSPLVGDGTLLRADLLLRAGSFDKSLELYQSVRDQFEPMRAKVEAFLDGTKDPRKFYERLAAQQLDVLDQNDELPPIAVRWAREAEDGPAAFRVIDDVNQCKTLIRQSYVLIDKLLAILGASNRVRAFPEIAAGEEQALGLLNRLSRARLALAKELDSQEPSSLGGEIGEARAARRQLMGMIGALPTTSGEFAERDYDGQRQWNKLSQELTRRGVEVDYLQATVNGLRRVLREDAQRGVTRDPATAKRFADELEANERELKKRRDEIAELRRMLEAGRLQVGLGDARYQNDALARQQFRDALDREVRLAAQGQAGGSAAQFAAQITPVLAQARATEDRLTAAFAALESQVAARVGVLKEKIEAERTKINGYNVQLATLDTEAQDLVGLVAKRNFEIVRDKLRNVVLRADVGITEQAWEVREEELDRVHTLQTERAKQETLLEEELREVLDDSGDAQGKPLK
ncbi:MAG: tetratricopeptide repeat protein [Myxococcales bacterium]|nr:tetratricopeptide repeat protein [Myxococcales bacterium]